MRRREFLAIVGGAAATWPLAVAAQEAGRNYRVAGLFGGSTREAPQTVAMFEQVRQAGFIEGQNLTVDWRTYGTHVELVSQFASELFKSPVDVIIVGGDPATKAAQKATTTIPILAFTDDMVGSGLVSSLANHGGNTTGVSLLATELDGKRQDILVEAVPGLRRMAALADITTTPHHFQALQDEARKRGIELLIQSVAKADGIAPAIDAAKASDVAALNVLASPLLFTNRQIIIERAGNASAGDIPMAGGG
jgi:putative ABC transport system substrate-binding protein